MELVYFLFYGNKLVTPTNNILPGITRDVVLELAQNHFAVIERDLTFDDLANADEAFITASNKEVMPVHHVNDLQIGSGKPGPNTQQIIAGFYNLTRNQSG